MATYDESTYGERIAPVYDNFYSGFDPAAVDLLAELAAGGRVLELGIGTGRIALPLRQRGVQIEGVDASPAMVAKLQAKPGGDAIPVTIGDMRAVPVDGNFGLVFVVFNTFFCLSTQEDQVECFASVARHLDTQGLFLMEVFVPDLGRFDRGQRVGAVSADGDNVRLEAGTVDLKNRPRDNPAYRHQYKRHPSLSGAGPLCLAVRA